MASAPGVVIRPSAAFRTAANLLNRHSAHEITEAITVLIDVLDLIGGDPGAQESEPQDAIGDERNMSWQNRSSQHRTGPNLGTEDIEPDYFGEMDDTP